MKPISWHHLVLPISLSCMIVFNLSGCSLRGETGEAEKANETFEKAVSSDEVLNSKLSASTHGKEQKIAKRTQSNRVQEKPQRNTSSDSLLNPRDLQNLDLRYMLERARREIEAGNLEEAEKTLSFGLERYPLDPQIISMRDEVRALLSRNTLGGTQEIENELLSSLEEYHLEAKKLYDDAVQNENLENWKEAEKNYQKLLELIRFAPYKAELNEKYEASAKAGLHQMRIKLLQSRDQERMQQQAEAMRLEELKTLAAEQRSREEVLRLWKQALYDLELKHFNRAKELSLQVLELDPNFRQAEDLLENIDKLRLEDLERETFERKIAGYREALLSIQEAIIPDTTLVVYPHGELARRIQERKSRLPDNIRLDRATQLIRSQLASTIVPLDYRDPTPLRDVIRYIREQANVNILLGENLGDKEVSGLSLFNVPLDSALEILLRQENLEKIYTDGVLMIVEEDSSASTDDKLFITQVHDIRDITYQLTDFSAPRITLSDGDSTSGSGPPPLPSKPQNIDVDDLIDLIMSGVEPDSWDRDPIVFNGQLIVSQTPLIQAKIQEFLGELRKTSGLLVSMEARFLSVEDDYLDDFGIDFRGLGGPSSVPNQAQLELEDVSSGLEDNAGGAFDNGTLGVPAANPSAGIFFNNDNPSGQVNFNRDIRGRFENIYDNALGSRLTNVGGLAMQVALFHNLTQINAIIQAVQKQRKARTLVEPRLSVYNTQRANIAIISQIPYIRDFEPEVSTSAAIANPELDSTFSGIIMEVSPNISNDRRFITIEVQPTIAELVLPIPTFTTTLGPSASVTIQIPELRVQEVKTTVRLPDGGAAVIGGFQDFREVDRESGVPFLSDLPLIGTLFRRKGRNTERSSLIIVIKAKIIDLNDEELRQPGWY